MDSVYFSFNNIKSEDMGVLLVKTESGMIGEPYLAEKEIISEQIIGNPIPYIYGYQNKPFSIKITLALDDGLFWTTEKRREIARWIDCNKFAEFYSCDDVNKVYFLCLEGGSELYTNGLQQGYIQLNFKSLSPFTYSKVYEEIHDFSTIASTTNFTLTNMGDEDLFPQEMWVLKYSVGDVSIKNNSDAGREFKFTALADQEEVYIQNDERYISTSLLNTYRYDAFNGNYFRLLRGVNYLQITGKCKVKLRYRFTLKG